QLGGVLLHPGPGDRRRLPRRDLPRARLDDDVDGRTRPLLGRVLAGRRVGDRGPRRVDDARSGALRAGREHIGLLPLLPGRTHTPSSQPAPTPAAQPSKDSSAVNADTSKTSTDSAASTQPAVSTTSDRPEKVPTTTAQIPAVELREPEVVKLRGPAAAVARNM